MRFKTVYKTRRFFFVLVLAALAFALPANVTAQTPADTPCDPKYYDSLEARAWLEAQREITQNQNLIFKPDSVLQYTCFDKFLSHLVNEEDNLFSGGDEWPAATSDTNMAFALQGLVGAAITSYLSGNFNHDLLGGQYIGISAPAPKIDEESYTCSMMEVVWETAALTAKCRDFIVNPDYDGFYTFAEYQAGTSGAATGLGDRRHLPQQCEPHIGDRWQENIELALIEATTPWIEDNVETYLNRMDPAECGDADNPPIETGIKVIRNAAPSNYDEKVCVTPGCFYDPTDGKCKP